MEQPRRKRPRLRAGLRRLLMPGAAVFALACPPPAIAAEAPRVRVELGREGTRPLPQRKGQKHRVLHFRECTLDTGKVRYGVSWKAAVVPGVTDRVFPVEGYIGMPRPTSCNWYHSGFLFIRLNGKEVGITPLYAMYVAETRPRGILDMVWRSRQADVRVRFIALPGADYLASIIDIEPRAGDLKSLQVMLRCYPSFFTAYHHRAGRRHLITPGGDILQGPRKSGPAARHWWCVYSDDVFDPARGEGEGPCAMLFDPGAATTVTFDPGSYAVTTTIDFAPATKQLRFLFWEFKGTPNTAAIERVRKNAGRLLSSLRAIDPVPADVAAIDLSAVRRALAVVQETPALRKRLAKQADKTMRWLERSRTVLSADRRSIVDEADLMAHRQEVESFVWEVRLAELLESVAGKR